VNEGDLSEELGELHHDSKYFTFNEIEFTEYTARFVGWTYGAANWQVSVDPQTGLDFFQSEQTFSGPYAFNEDYLNTKYMYYQTGVGYFATNLQMDTQTL
jgi:hypothetical protein